MPSRGFFSFVRELAVVQRSILPSTLMPRLEHAVASQQPFEPVRGVAVEEHGDDRRYPGWIRFLARLRERARPPSRASASTKKRSPLKRLLAAHAGARAARARASELLVLDLDLAAAAALEGVRLPLRLVELVAVELVAPLFDGGLRACSASRARSDSAARRC